MQRAKRKWERGTWGRGRWNAVGECGPRTWECVVRAPLDGARVSRPALHIPAPHPAFHISHAAFALHVAPSLPRSRSFALWSLIMRRAPVALRYVVTLAARSQWAFGLSSLECFCSASAAIWSRPTRRIRRSPRKCMGSIPYKTCSGMGSVRRSIGRCSSSCRLVLGGYALVVGLGFDRLGAPSPAYEPSARAEPTPDEHAAFQLTMTQARLTGAGFMVQRLEGGKGLRVSGNRFVGAILPSGTAWRVVCDERSFDVASLPEAEAKILECHQPG